MILHKEIEEKIEELEHTMFLIKLNYLETFNQKLHKRMCEQMTELKIMTWKYLKENEKKEEKIIR